MPSPLAPTFRALVSYLPISLYAESLRLNSAIVLAIAGRSILPLPTTGCIRDLGRIWHISPSDVLSDFDLEDRLVAASLRHGNSFPLVNSAVLRRASIIKRREAHKESDEAAFVPRQTFVYLTYLIPATQPTQLSNQNFFSWVAIFSELATLIGTSTMCFYYGLFVGGLLSLCQVASAVLLFSIEYVSAFIFAHEKAIEKDTKLTVAHGAALDAHVVVQGWNATNIDVIIGYSAQLHAMTNIPGKIKRWRTVKLLLRTLAMVLLIQAALLGSLLNNGTKQIWGSLIWLVGHMAMILVARLELWQNPDAFLGPQLFRVSRLSPVSFGGRKPALAFIATLPGVAFRHGVGRWDWICGFMPDNDRRREWTTEFSDADRDDVVEGSEQWNRLTDSCRWVLSEVRAARSAALYKSSSGKFLIATGSNARPS
jgi:hypothetical protein